MDNYDVQQEQSERLWPIEDDLLDEDLKNFLEDLLKEWEKEMRYSQ